MRRVCAKTLQSEISRHEVRLLGLGGAVRDQILGQFEGVLEGVVVGTVIYTSETKQEPTVLQLVA